MKEKEKFSDRYKELGGCFWVMFLGFVIAGLFSIIGGAIIYNLNKGTVEGSIAVVCITVGAICEAFFLGIGFIVPFIQWRLEISPKKMRIWKSGILTPQIIKKDIKAQRKDKFIGWIICTVLLGLFSLMVNCLSEEINWIMVLLPVVTIVIAIKERIFNKQYNYRIESDRVIDKGIKTTFDVVDALTTHLPTKDAALYFEKHGEYLINSVQIHRYFYPEEIMNYIEIGEEVYIVYSNSDDKILHIYLKKHWKIEN